MRMGRSTAAVLKLWLRDGGVEETTGGVTMNSEDDRRSSADSDDGHDAEVGRVFDAYLAELEAGRSVDPEQLCAEHPHLADRLRACLEVMDWADDAVDAPPGSSAWTSFRGSCGTDGSSTPRDCDGELPSVLLRELPGEPVPMLRALPASLSAGRYRLLGEIARGGMGAVLKGHDAELGRELAVKILLRRHSRDPDIVRRFTEEAQIGGQLQHPGVVPVYDVGLLPDRRPFFAMKLVQGRTLAALLAERPNSDHDRTRFVGIFEQVCQAVAYAHARGVIHRDLKPSNVMVGTFGEVQVMDWGLAKVLTQGGIADEARSPDAQKTQYELSLVRRIATRRRSGACWERRRTWRRNRRGARWGGWTSGPTFFRWGRSYARL